MSIEARRAGRADLVALVSLNEAGQSVHATIYPAVLKPAPSRPDVREFFAARLAEEKSTIAIAEIDRQPAGYVWFANADARRFFMSLGFGDLTLTVSKKLTS